MTALIDALDLSVPKAKALSHQSKRADSPKSEAEHSSPEPILAISTPAPRLDDRRLQCRRSKLSKNRRQAKSRRFEQPPPASQPDASPTGLVSKRLELRAHAHPLQAGEQNPQPPSSEPATTKRRWNTKADAKRKALSLPPQRSSHFVVVDEEVGDSNTPVCGIDLGPFLSWLSCMPVIPEGKAEGFDEEDAKPAKPTAHSNRGRSTPY